MPSMLLFDQEGLTGPRPVLVSIKMSVMQTITAGIFPTHLEEQSVLLDLVAKALVE